MCNLSDAFSTISATPVSRNMRHSMNIFYSLHFQDSTYTDIFSSGLDGNVQPIRARHVKNSWYVLIRHTILNTFEIDIEPIGQLSQMLQ